jgi:thiol:disulfide interchange protein DsbC
MKTLPLLAALLLSPLAACAPPYHPAAAADTSVAPAVEAKSEPAVKTDETPDIAELREKLSKKLDIKIESIRPSPLPGFYEVQTGMNFGYVSADGEYLIEGDLVRISTGEAITDASRKKARLAALDKIGVANMIVFAPEAPRHTITVFTDIDCGYCRLLHSQVAAYNAKGIAIRYVFYPRSGPDTESFRKAEAVWCSADRKAAFTSAKRTGKVDGDSSCKNPVMDEYLAGLAMGVRGTPALVLDDGELLPGYQPPDNLAQALDARDLQLKSANKGG